MSVEVTYHTPSSSMQWLVNQYEFIRFDGKSKVLDKFIPREDISLVFHFHTPPFMLEPGQGLLPPYFIAPVITQANLMRISKKNETFIVTCKPSVFSRIFNINLAPESTIYLPLKKSLFEPLWKQLAHLTEFQHRINCFEEFIAACYPFVYKPDEVDDFYQSILEEGLYKPLMEIESSISVSLRTIQRRFRKRIGVCPKVLVRIVRINHLWEKIKNNEPVDYHSMVYEGNYFDQTHFIKDFKAITGETPDCFFRRDLHHVKILSGKKA